MTVPTAGTGRGLRLRVEVASPPEASVLRAAIEATLAGRAWLPGPEAAVARAVADAVRDARPGSDGHAAHDPSDVPWR